MIRVRTALALAPAATLALRLHDVLLGHRTQLLRFANLRALALGRLKGNLIRERDERERETREIEKEDREENFLF